jgi:hypothetical protein
LKTVAVVVGKITDDVVVFVKIKKKLNTVKINETIKLELMLDFFRYIKI